jgi:hypothetical protein
MNFGNHAVAGQENWGDPLVWRKKSNNEGVLDWGTARARWERLELHLEFMKTGSQIMRQVSQGMPGGGKGGFMEQVFA